MGPIINNMSTAVNMLSILTGNFFKLHLKIYKKNILEKNVYLTITRQREPVHLFHHLAKLSSPVSNELYMYIYIRPIYPKYISSYFQQQLSNLRSIMDIDFSNSCKSAFEFIS